MGKMGSLISLLESSNMVRTKGDGGAARTVASKAPRKVLVGGGSSGAANRAIASAAGGAGFGVGSPTGKYSGGNSYNPQPTPAWQKPISFFTSDLNKESSVEEDNLAAKNEMVKAKGKGKEEKENKSKMEKNGVFTDTDSDNE